MDGLQVTDRIESSANGARSANRARGGGFFMTLIIVIGLVGLIVLGSIAFALEISNEE